MLGPGKIVGVTASSPDEALAACRAGATYLGLGTVFATQTFAPLLGPRPMSAAHLSRAV